MTRTKMVCPDCGQEISKSNFSKHQRRHKDHPETFKTPRYRVTHEGLNCQFCGKTCKNNNSLINHECRCKLNTDRTNIIRQGFNNNGREAWNKGLTKETDERVALQGKHFSERIAEGLINLHSRPHENTFNKRYKYGTYKGFYCDSSWELAFIMFMLDNNKNIKRNYTSFTYINSSGKQSLFYPDFMIDNTFYEIKGGYDIEADNKKNQFPEPDKLIWISETEIKPYIRYCEEKYGKDFICLYDIDKPSWMNKKKDT